MVSSERTRTLCRRWRAFRLDYHGLVIGYVHAEGFVHTFDVEVCKDQANARSPYRGGQFLPTFTSANLRHACNRRAISQRLLQAALNLLLRQVSSEVQRENCDVPDAHGNALGAGEYLRGSVSYFQVAYGSTGGARRLQAGALVEGARRFRHVADDGDVEDSPAVASAGGASARLPWLTSCRVADAPSPFSNAISVLDSQLIGVVGLPLPTLTFGLNGSCLVGVAGVTSPFAKAIGSANPRDAGDQCVR